MKLVISILLCQLAGVIGSVFTQPAISQWYAFLHKPSFNPPNWVFAPVWTILFTLMGVAAYLVWRKGFQTKGVRKAIGMFLFQLALNCLWSIVFFGCRSIAGGLIVIVLLWGAILWTMIRFSYFSKWAMVLLLPYFAWVSFATILNEELFFLNLK